SILSLHDALPIWIAGVPVRFDTTACQVCHKDARPRDVNKVTTDIAAHALRQAGHHEAALRLIRQWHHGHMTSGQAARGVGAEFARALPWVDAANPGCDCASYIHLMNQWGPEK